MRSFRHLTVKYIIDRVAVFYYEKQYPDHPWLTRSANEILDSYLTSSDIGLEFGSGRSTLWFSKRIAHLTTVEHDKTWGEIVARMLEEESIRNVDYNLFPEDIINNEGKNSAYVGVADKFDDGSLDFCLIDGSHRGFCALRCIEKIRPGGILVIDNVNWFLCSDSRSPNSRSFIDGPDGSVWEEVNNIISDWKRIWTSNGVSDTALFFKPHS